MALTHNQINRLWYRPTYESFKNSSLVKRIFDETDAEDFLKTGAYLIKEAEKLTGALIGWDNRKRFEILKNPRLENAFMSLGAEYLMKGVFLHNGYAINEPIPGIRGIAHPIPLSKNKGKLSAIEVQDIYYTVSHLDKIVDFSEFDNLQMESEKKAKAELKGQKLSNITRMTIPYPTSKQLIEYLRFKRNYSLHRPFIIPEFKGLTDQLFKFLDYIAQQGRGVSIEELAKLSDS